MAASVILLLSSHFWEVELNKKLIIYIIIGLVFIYITIWLISYFRCQSIIQGYDKFGVDLGITKVFPFPQCGCPYGGGCL